MLKQRPFFIAVGIIFLFIIVPPILALVFGIWPPSCKWVIYQRAIEMCEKAKSGKTIESPKQETGAPTYTSQATNSTEGAEKSIVPKEEQPIISPKTTETAKPKQMVEVSLTVTVPYWNQGDVYLGVADNPTYLKLEKVNEVTYKGMTKIEKDGEYYYSRGSLATKSANTFKATDLPKGLNAVIDWIDSNKKISLAGFQKGVTFGGMLWQPEQLAVSGIIDYNLDLARKFGVEWITIIPDWFFYPDLNSSTIRPWYVSDGPFPNKSGWVTPTLTDEQIESIILKAKTRGMKIMLKPHVDPIDWGPQQPKGRGDIQPRNWDEWYSNYTNYILRYAKLAEKNKVEIYVIGTEIDPAAMEDHPYGPAGGGQTEYFKKLISEVKKVYSGKLTYSSSCHGECWGIRSIKFWEDLDYIGFEPYYSLTEKLNPTIEELKQGFLKGLNTWGKEVYQTYNKPLILSEVSYHSFDGSGKYVINTPSSPRLDLQEQADLYEAMMQALEERPWIQGVYPWAWYLVRPDDNMEWQLRDTDGPFIGKPAGQVIKKWYAKVED